jgi:hypothetical protein
MGHAKRPGRARKLTRSDPKNQGPSREEARLDEDLGKGDDQGLWTGSESVKYLKPTREVKMALRETRRLTMA